MKDYKKLLDEYDHFNVAVIYHKWGQNRNSLYNQIVRLWNRLDVGNKIAIISNEKFGIKTAVKIFAKDGLQPKIVGKGADGLRVVEIVKDSANPLSTIEAPYRTEFHTSAEKDLEPLVWVIFSRLIESLVM